MESRDKKYDLPDLSSLLTAETCPHGYDTDKCIYCLKVMLKTVQSQLHDWQDAFAKYGITPDEAGNAICKESKNKLEELEARLPRTADGVLIVPPTSCWKVWGLQPTIRELRVDSIGIRRDEWFAWNCSDEQGVVATNVNRLFHSKQKAEDSVKKRELLHDEAMIILNATKAAYEHSEPGLGYYTEIAAIKGEKVWISVKRVKEQESTPSDTA